MPWSLCVREQWRTSKRLHDCSVIFARTHRSHFYRRWIFQICSHAPRGCESKYFISFTLGVSIKYFKINPGVKKFFIKIINYTPGWECSDQSAPSLHSKFYNSNRWNFESGWQVLFRCSQAKAEQAAQVPLLPFKFYLCCILFALCLQQQKMFSTYQHRQKACSPMQRVKSAALETSPTVAELVELQKLGILSKEEEIRKIILRAPTPSPSNKKRFLSQRQVFEEQRSEVQHGDAPVPQKRDTSVWFK